ncbi:MAG: tetratricopeptide repeat protein, partial [Deltaproteobacteria bacterium]
MSPAQRRQRIRAGESLLAELDGLDVEPFSRQLVRADILRRIGRYDQSLAILHALSEKAGPDVAARASLISGQVLMSLGMEEAAEDEFLVVAASENPLLRQKGLRLLLDALEAGHHGARLRKLQNLFEKTRDNPFIRQRLLLEMARMHEGEGRAESARLALLRAAELAPRSQLAVKVYLELSRLAEQRGRLEEAAGYLARLKGRHDLDSKLKKQLDTRLLGLKLARLRRVTSNGDVARALELADEAVEEFPNSLRAWREWLELMDAAGRQAEALKRVRRLVDSSRNEALGQYLVGLALTYVDPPRNFEKAVGHLQKAAKLAPDSPFPHQTLGWLREQQASLQRNPDYLPEAASHYERALEVLGAKASLEDRADLWLDLGNIYLQLGNFELALRYLEKRGRCAVGFRRGERRLLFMRNWARAAFLAEKFEKAADLYGRAAKLADELVLPAWRTRLLEAEAASLQLAGNHDEAAERFGEACRLAEKDRLHWARCARSQGYNLVLAGRFREGIEVLRRARRIFARRAATEKAGINIDVGMSSESSRAPLGFSASQELVFVDTMIARAMRKMGDWRGALAAQNRKFTVLRGMLHRLDDERLWLDVALAATGSMRDWLALGRVGMARRAAEEALKAAAATKQGHALAVAASNVLELELARGLDWPEHDTAGLEEQLQRAVELLEQEQSDLELVARTMGNLAVLLAGRCGPARERSRVREADRAIALGVAKLDSCLAAAAKAETLLRRAKEAAGRIEGLDGMRVKTLASINLARLYELLGSRQQARSEYAEAERLVEEGVLYGVRWRFGPLRERAERLASLPPPLAGCPRSSMLCRERDSLFGGLVASAVAEGKAAEAFRWMEQWALLRRRDRLWSGLEKLGGEAARWHGEMEKLMADVERTERDLPPPDGRNEWRKGRLRLFEKMEREIRGAG